MNVGKFCFFFSDKVNVDKQREIGFIVYSFGRPLHQWRARPIVYLQTSKNFRNVLIWLNPFKLILVLLKGQKINYLLSKLVAVIIKVVLTFVTSFKKTFLEILVWE